MEDGLNFMEADEPCWLASTESALAAAAAVDIVDGIVELVDAEPVAQVEL